jgi:probable HAF family extracellular repeat protein
MSALRTVKAVVGALALTTGLVIVPSTGTAHAAELSPTDLGTLGGRNSQANAINNLGEVAGASDIAGNGASHAFVWTDIDGMIDLGTLGGTNSVAYGMNDLGQVIGDSQVASDAADRAFVWDEVNGMVDLGTLGGTNSYASGINEAGQIAGEADVVGDVGTHAVLWDPIDGMIDLGTLGGTTSAALAVNESGQVVGASTIAGNTETHAFIWDEVNGMVDIGTLGDTFGVAFAINDGGQVVGRSRPPAQSSHAFLWDEINGMADLGTLGGAFSAAYGINSSGQVAGYSDTATLFQQRAFIWDEVNGMLPLGTLGGDDSFGFAINEAGQVAGYADLPGNRHHAARWSDAVGTLSIASAAVVEGDGPVTRNLQFVVTLSEPSPNPVTVGFSVRETDTPSATSPDDFKARSGTITFRPKSNGLTATSLSVSTPIPGDTDVEGDETFEVVLSNPTGGYSLGSATAVGTIIDDDPTGGPLLSIGDTSIVEGDSSSTASGINTAQMRIKLSEPVPSPVRVTVTITPSGISLGDDIKAIKTTRTITFQAGQQHKTLALGVFPDVEAESDEAITVTLSSPVGASLGRDVGTFTVIDDD